MNIIEITYKKTSSVAALEVSNAFPYSTNFDKETNHELYKN